VKSGGKSHAYHERGLFWFLKGFFLIYYSIYLVLQVNYSADELPP
jgi:hypothetical protein